MDLSARILASFLKLFMWTIVIVLLTIPKIRTARIKKLSYLLCVYVILVGLVMAQGAKVYRAYSLQKFQID